MSGYTYPATVMRVVDGDTVKLDLDLGVSCYGKDQSPGFHLYVVAHRLHYHATVRLLGINCAEHGTPSGDAATAFLTALLLVGDAVTVRTTLTPFDKYGQRIDAVVVTPAGNDVAALLVATGHAVYWDGHGPRPLPPWPIPV